jgi:hypothetical protein
VVDTGIFNSDHCCYYFSSKNRAIVFKMDLVEKALLVTIMCRKMGEKEKNQSGG